MCCPTEVEGEWGREGALCLRMEIMVDGLREQQKETVKLIDVVEKVLFYISNRYKQEVPGRVYGGGGPSEETT